MLHLSTASRNAALNGTGFKEQFDGGFLYLFATNSSAPANADMALNMGTTHTEVVKISLNGLGATGLTFAVPSGGILSKTVSEDWQGAAAFDGVQSASPTLVPLFYRFCAAGDNGRGAAHATTGYRIQGAVGGPSSGADLEIGNINIAPSFMQIVETFNWTLLGA